MCPNYHTMVVEELGEYQQHYKKEKEIVILQNFVETKIKLPIKKEKIFLKQGYLIKVCTLQTFF